MSKFIFITFPDEAKAYEGTRALETLHADGDLTLYGMAVVAKGTDGKVAVKQESDRGALGMAVGAVAGAMVGLLGGPLGAVAGMGAGAFLGSLNDLANLGVSGEFLDSISADLNPDTVAIVAEVSEEWVTPLNSQMNLLGGVVHRTERAAVEDELSQREMTSAKAELSQLKAEYDHAQAEGKTALQTRMDEVEGKAHTASVRLHTRMGVLKQETEAKLKALQTQAATATGELKAKIDTRIAELHVDGERRSNQLREAWGLTKKAMAS